MCCRLRYEEQRRTSCRGSTHMMWAYAEVFGLDTLFTEDLEHNRYYGTVRVVNPFTAER